jgi:hypothetical protein
MEEANCWRVMDANKDEADVQFDGTAQLRGIHVRCAKLLGLDTATRIPKPRLHPRAAARQAEPRIIDRPASGIGVPQYHLT